MLTITHLRNAAVSDAQIATCVAAVIYLGSRTTATSAILAARKASIAISSLVLANGLYPSAEL